MATSERLGFDVDPPEAMVNLLGYRLLGEGRISQAIEVFEYNVDLHPDSANVHDSLGEALERQGRLPGAMRCYRRAVVRAERSNDGRLPIFDGNLLRVEALLDVKPPWKDGWAHPWKDRRAELDRDPPRAVDLLRRAGSPTSSPTSVSRASTPAPRSMSVKTALTRAPFACGRSLVPSGRRSSTKRGGSTATTSTTPGGTVPIGRP